MFTLNGEMGDSTVETGGFQIQSWELKPTKYTPGHKHTLKMTMVVKHPSVKFTVYIRV